jgi:membrane-bound lytic murein transglycosylase F
LAASAINSVFRNQSGLPLVILGIWLAAVFYFGSPQVENHKFATLYKVLKSQEITVITRNNAHCYYLYRDEPMGFEYDLAKAFADYLGVRLNVTVAESWSKMHQSLIDGTAAVVAAGMTNGLTRHDQVAFSDGYLEIQQHIITNRKAPPIKSVKDLAEKVIHVRRGTAYYDRLKALQEQGIDLSIDVHDDIPIEELIRKVAEGEIDFTVARNNIALLNRRYYPGAIMSAAISDKEYLSWAVNSKARRLLQRVNSFFKVIRENGEFERIYNRYYGDVDDFDYVDLKTFHERLKTRLSSYAPFIKAAAKRHDFDWRLVAAQVYQESHLNPLAKSSAGARGLMQILPSTGKGLGINDLHDPVQNINAGVQHLRTLYDFFDDAEEPDRLYIALAAYNIGHGHILDAQNLARKMDLDPNKWDSLCQTLPLLQYRKYYQNARYGYCRGTEPVRYVKQIMIYYDILKRQEIELNSNQAQK